MAQPWRVAITMLVQFCAHDITLNPALIVCNQTKYGIHGNECRDWALNGALRVLVGRWGLDVGLLRMPALIAMALELPLWGCQAC